jgi:hypothetical protein
MDATWPADGCISGRYANTGRQCVRVKCGREGCERRAVAVLEIRRRGRGGDREPGEPVGDPLPLCVEHMNAWSDEIPPDCKARFVPVPRSGQN